MNRNDVALSLTITLSLLASRGAASAQDPGTTESPAVMTASDVLLPLQIAAEADTAAARYSLAIARARLVLESAAATTLRVRAQSVTLVATEALGAAAPSTEPLDLVLEPLIVAVSREIEAGHDALALAHLDFVLERAPADGTLAASARALRDVIAGPRAAAVVETSPPPVVVVPLPVAPVASVAVVRAPEYVEAEVETAEPAEPVVPRDPTRRGDGEVVELAITAGLFGAYTGFWIPFASGLEGGSGRDAGAANTVYSLGILAGGALFALGAIGLDSGDGLRTGVAPAMSTGLRLGTLTGFLLWGATDRMLSPTVQCSSIGGSSCAEQRAGWTERTAFPFALGLSGLLAGAVVGYGLNPTTEQVRFVELQGTLWGGLIGIMLSAVAQQGDADDVPRGMGITAGGLAAGVLATAIMSGVGMRMSQSRAWLMTAGLAVGAVAAALVSTIVNGATGEWAAWPITFGGIGAVTSVAGLVVAGILTDGMDAPRAAHASEGPSIDIRPTLAPLDGGGMVGVTGTF